MKRIIRDLIRQKKIEGYFTVDPEASNFEALNVLEDTKTSAILVSRNGALLGIFSEKDFARAHMRGRTHLNSKVETVMTQKVYYVEPTFTLEECLQIMSKIHVRHLPVIEGSKIIALLSMRQIVELLVEDKDSQIRELTTYITGYSQFTNSMDRSKPLDVPIFSTSKEQEAI